MNTNEETAVLTLLGRQSSQSFEELMALSGLSASGPAVVDRLSREGAVVVLKIGWTIPSHWGARYEQD